MQGRAGRSVAQAARNRRGGQGVGVAKRVAHEGREQAHVGAQARAHAALEPDQAGFMGAFYLLEFGR